MFKNPLVYRHILAVTFTNKAAREMKTRILDRLYALSDLKEDESSDDLQDLIAHTGLNRELVVAASKNLLVRILNDYSRFSVGTIDKFFQSVIRAFTREIGLSSGYVLELDRDRILREAADRLFLNIDVDKSLLEWMIRLAESRIEASKGWNFKTDMLQLGEELFSEKFQDLALHNENELTRDNIDVLIRQVKTLINTSEKKIRDAASEIMERVQNAGYTAEDFSGKSKGPAYFIKNISDGGDVVFTDARKNAIDDQFKWISKNESNPQRITLANEVFMPGLKDIYKHYINFQSGKSVQNYVYALGILSDLSLKIFELTDEKNIFLLSDASRFLKGLIGDNPTPFIYEKTGNFIEHIMLDEFQDTSVFQWENFRPLLGHTLSVGKENTVVGDIKQSIYRWRNSDWKILAEVVQNAFPEFDTSEVPLLENWRSRERIIRFNNTLFKHAPGIVRGLIGARFEKFELDQSFKNRWMDLFDKAYDDVVQVIPNKDNIDGGFVGGVVFDDENRSNREAALEKLADWIIELEDAGYMAGDIAILVRTNREGADVANQLMRSGKRGSLPGYNFNFISNDSLFLSNNPAVNLLVCAMKYIVDPGDSLNAINLKYFYSVLNRQDNEQISGSLLPGVTIADVLGMEFVSMIPELDRLPLFELVEKLILHFGLADSSPDIVYIQAFQEIILDIQHRDPGSLYDFITYWNEFGDTKSISVSEMQDAISIMTIHKAKGLQFKAVIVPFCDWNLSNRGTGNKDQILWCSTDNTPFDAIPAVPVKFTDALGETVFSENYSEELVMGYIDSLNLLYVALTRAEEALMLGLPGPNKSGTVSKAGHLVVEAALQSDGSEGDNFIDIARSMNGHGFAVGKLLANEETRKETDHSQRIIHYPVNFRNERIRLRMKSSEYLLKEANRDDDHLSFGNIMHHMFSHINTKADINKVVKDFFMEGLLREEDAGKIEELIISKISRPEVSGWFSDKNRVIKERDIIFEGNTYRPDRVIINDHATIVIDYKFGDVEDNRYVRQVKRYMDLLSQLKYTGIEGFVWYVMQDKKLKVS